MELIKFLTSDSRGFFMRGLRRNKVVSKKKAKE